jgi:F-type H+-transporting ATPase subunit a
MFNKFADSGPVIHITSLPLFHIGPLAITNSIFYGWICSAVLCFLLILAARHVTLNPKGGLIQVIEVGVEFIRNLIESSFEDKERSYKYVPYFVTLFFFLLMNNWLGLIPGVGESFVIHGNPLLRAFTGDLNATLAIGIVTMGYVYYSSIKESGVKAYFRHFFIGNPLNPLYLIIGLLEILTDATRVISLSLRLFLNVTIGEIIISVFSYLGGFVAPLTAAPFVLIEIFICALQAYIFVILSVMYLAIAVNHSSEEHLTDDALPETINGGAKVAA